MSSKAACHIELRENLVWEWVQDKTINVQHLSGQINPDKIFTKEMPDGTHFCCLQDLFMSRLSDFINSSLLAILHTRQRSSRQVLSAATQVILTVHPSSYPSARVSSSFCCTFAAISHLCSAGCHPV
jgi:hypothetical protein